MQRNAKKQYQKMTKKGFKQNDSGLFGEELEELEKKRKENKGRQEELKVIAEEKG